MRRFRFVAVDSSGSVKRGVMSAPTRDEAVARIERHGLQVREVAPEDEATPPPASTAAAAGRNGDALGLPEDEPVRPGPTARSPSRGSTSRLPLFMSVAALVVAIAALAVAVLRSPLGRGISSYDFSTPEAAAKSLVQIEKNRDFKARLELSELEDGRSGEEMARTFEIHRTADFNDRKILFVSYTKKGKKIKRIESFEKDSETKLWFRKYVSESDVRKVNEQLAKEMDAWRSKDDD